jgi:hypothetical protein
MNPAERTEVQPLRPHHRSVPLPSPNAGLTLNPDRDAEWIPAPDDEVVVLVSYAKPDREA